MADYRFKEWFGIRAGKVKTALGLYNDNQDQDTLHTWALLPQSMYPVDLRSSTIAHNGVDFYGTIPLRRLGSIAYTAYAGMTPNDPHQGYLYFLSSILPTPSYTGPMGGGDAKWTTPIKGVLVSASILTKHPSGSGMSVGNAFSPSTPFSQYSKKNEISQYYVQYIFRGLTIDGEYRRDYRDQVLSQGGSANDIFWDARSIYGSAAYRIHPRLEIGSYYSFFIPHWNQDWTPPGNHITDKVVTARIDLTKFWTVKVEGHFINGYGQVDSARGFYDLAAPGGPAGPGVASAVTTTKPLTNMLVIKTGFTF